MSSTVKADPDPLVSANISAVSTKQAAIIGAVAVALAAILSLLSAVISGNISARATAKVTDEQIASEMEKSRTEFTRTQRQDAYATMLADENQLRFIEWRIRNIVNTDRPLKDYLKQANLADDQLMILARDVGNVEVIGGAASITAVDAMQALHWRRSGWISYGRDQLAKDRQMDRKKKQDLIAGIVGEDPKLLQLQVDFKVAARADLAN